MIEHSLIVVTIGNRLQLDVPDPSLRRDDTDQRDHSIDDSITANLKLQTAAIHLQQIERMRKLSMEELNRKSAEEFRQSDKMPVIAVLENVRSAYNVGSVFRTADAFLLEGIYICGYTAHPPHKEIKKTALGADETVHWKHFKQIGEAIAALREAGYRIFAVEQAEDSHKLQALSLKQGEKIAVVFGNEVTGVEQSTIEQCDGCIEIPQLGMKHSLNISVAAGIVLWEIVRGKLNDIKHRNSG